MTKQDRDDIEAMPMTPTNAPDDRAAAQPPTITEDVTRGSGPSGGSEFGIVKPCSFRDSVLGDVSIKLSPTYITITVGRRDLFFRRADGLLDGTGMVIDPSGVVGCTEGCIQQSTAPPEDRETVSAG